VTDGLRKVDLVLEGGGVKGIGLVGAIVTLVDAGYGFPRVAGTSAGAIVASLVAAYQRAGMDLRRLVDVMDRVEYEKFADGPLLERVTGRLGEAVELALHEGAHSGHYLCEWLGPELERAGVRTFRDLALDDPESSLQPHQRYSCVVHASDLSRRVLVRLPWDYGEYGITADDEPVVEAVRASMSIPFYFQPVTRKTDRGRVTWVDGGLLSNFPITVFDRTDGRPPRWPTWGIKLSAQPRASKDSPVRTAPGLALSCLETVTGEWNRYALESEGVNRRTIYIDTSGVSATDFTIDRSARQQLFDSGRAAAAKFLDLHRLDDTIE
jgi:NTE family protein